MIVSAIYQIQSKCKPNRKYIGSAINIAKRWGDHLNRLRRNKHHSKKLQRHYNKYGEADLQFSIILGCDKEDLIKNEQYFLDAYRPYFNICLIAGSVLGLKKGASWNRGISPSEEIKEKLRKANLGKPQSLETRQKRSQSMKGKNTWQKGRKFSEETKAKMRASQKARIRKSHTEEAKQKMRLAKLGKKLSPEHKQKIGNSVKSYILLKKIKLTPINSN